MNDSQTRLSLPGRIRVFWLVAIVVAAFAMRLVATVRFEGLDAPPNAGAFYDGVEFEEIAANLVARGEFSVRAGHPTSFRAPGLPFALAAVYAAFGNRNFVAAHVLFCLIGASAAWAAYLVARELLGDWGGLITAGLVAGYPNLLYYSMHFSSEPLFTVLLALAVWSFIRALRTDAIPHYALSGVLLGLAALTRPVAFYFLPFFVLAALWTTPAPWSRRVLSFAVMAAALMLPIAPWAIRNYQVHDRPLMFASNGGSTFWGANNEIVLNDPKYRGDWITTEAMPEQKRAVHALPNEVDRDKLEWEYGKAFLKAHPSDVPKLLWYKFYALWTPISRTPNAAFNTIHLVSYGLALPFMVVGLAVLLSARGWRDPAITSILAPILATTASTLVFYGSARFRSTIEPLLLVFVAAALLAAYSPLRAGLTEHGSRRGG